MQLQTNIHRAPALSRPRIQFNAPHAVRRPQPRPQAREAGLTTEQIRQIVIDQIG